MRAELNIPWSASLVPHVIGGDAAMLERLDDEWRDAVAAWPSSIRRNGR